MELYSYGWPKWIAEIPANAKQGACAKQNQKKRRKALRRKGGGRKKK